MKVFCIVIESLPKEQALEWSYTEANALQINDARSYKLHAIFARTYCTHMYKILSLTYIQVVMCFGPIVHEQIELSYRALQTMPILGTKISLLYI